MFKPKKLIRRFRDMTVLFVWKIRARRQLKKYRQTKNFKRSMLPAEGIVFSKDRALQLHALLSSYCERVRNKLPLHVLYASSDERHNRAYEEVVELFPNSGITFHRQSGSTCFRTDLIHILKSLKSDKVFFLVDDIVFVEEVDLLDFAKFDTRKFIPSLRLGMNLRWCYTLQKPQQLPKWKRCPFLDADKLCWRWRDGEYDWGYPLSLDGHLFSKHEIIGMAESIPFSAPNTFEANLQHFLVFFLRRYGICYKKAITINIPCNRVQQEIANLCGDIHQDLLLEKWENGYQMDFRKLYGFVNESAHQEIEFGFTKRNL